MQRARSSDLWISSLTCSRLSWAGWYVEWDLNFCCTVLFIATMLYVAVSCMHNNVIYKYVWACTSRCEQIILPISSTTLFSVLIKTIWYLPDATIAWLCSDATYNIEAIYNIVQQKFCLLLHEQVQYNCCWYLWFVYNEWSTEQTIWLWESLVGFIFLGRKWCYIFL